MFKTNIYKDASDKKIKEIFDFAESYKVFLKNGKTERLAVKETVKLAKGKGFKDLEEAKEIKAGDKLYKVNKNKSVILFIVGKKPITDGLRILGAHIDSPRLDLKAQPLYEDNGFTLLDTHYYGGISSPKHPVSCIEPGLATRFIHDILHVSMPFSQIFPPSPSLTESIRLFYTSVSLLLSRTQGYCYHLSKFHIYALVYCIGVFLSGLLHSV